MLAEKLPPVGTTDELCREAMDVLNVTPKQGMDCLEVLNNGGTLRHLPPDDSLTRQELRDELKDELGSFAQGALRTELQEQFQLCVLELQDTLRKEIKACINADDLLLPLLRECLTSEDLQGNRSSRASSLAKSRPDSKDQATHRASPPPGGVLSVDGPPNSGSLYKTIAPVPQANGVIKNVLPGMIAKDAEELEGALEVIENGKGGKTADSTRDSPVISEDEDGSRGNASPLSFTSDEQEQRQNNAPLRGPAAPYSHWKVNGINENMQELAVHRDKLNNQPAAFRGSLLEEKGLDPQAQSISSQDGVSRVKSLSNGTRRESKDPSAQMGSCATNGFAHEESDGMAMRSSVAASEYSDSDSNSIFGLDGGMGKFDRGDSDKKGGKKLKRGQTQNKLNQMTGSTSMMSVTSEFTLGDTLDNPQTITEVEDEVDEQYNPNCLDRVSDRAQAIVESGPFDYIFAIVIFLNAISMGIQTEWVARNSADLVPIEMQLFDTAFAILFITELTLRLMAYRMSFFWRNGWQWNWFDCVLVGMQLFEEIIVMAARISGTEDGNAGSGGGNLSFLRVLRVLRLVRLVRLARVLRYVRQLRTLVCSIAVSLQSLGWTVLLIMLMIYVVGIYVTQMVSDQRSQLSAEEQSRESFAKLDYYFGSLGRSILTLFEAITGGVDWDELANPLSVEISTLTGAFFACYIAFAILAMMNVVTGVFVESALQGSAQDKESQIVNTLQDLFEEFDEDRSGKISEEEFRTMCANPNCVSQLKALDVNLIQARSLFHLIDIDRSGEIPINAFIMGCLRLRGTARAADMTTLIFELKRFMSRWQAHANMVEEGLKAQLKFAMGAGQLSRTSLAVPGAGSRQFGSTMSLSTAADPTQSVLGSRLLLLPESQEDGAHGPQDRVDEA